MPAEAPRFLEGSHTSWLTRVVTGHARATIGANGIRINLRTDGRLAADLKSATEVWS